MEKYRQNLFSWKLLSFLRQSIYFPQEGLTVRFFNRKKHLFETRIDCAYFLLLCFQNCVQRLSTAFVLCPFWNYILAATITQRHQHKEVQTHRGPPKTRLMARIPEGSLSTSSGNPISWTKLQRHRIQESKRRDGMNAELSLLAFPASVQTRHEAKKTSETAVSVHLLILRTS